MDTQNPYQAPIADGPAAETFVVGGARARSLAFVLLVYCFVAVLSIVAGLLYVLAMMDGRAPSAEDAPATDEEMIQGFLMLLHFTVFVVTAVMFCRFAVQANWNARALAGYVSYSPASMVWWYFVPIASLWKPYGAIRDVWRATVQRMGTEPSWDDLRMWWAGWVLSNILDNISLKMSRDVMSPSLASECIDIASTALMIFSAVFLRRWVLALDADQQRAFAASTPS